MEVPDKNILVYFDAVVKKQGRGGRIFPNPFPDHVGKKAIVIILDEECTEEPQRIALQLQNRAKKIISE